MYFRAFPIALSFRGILSGPVAVIRSQSRALPCSLLHHLRDLRIGDFQAVLDGIAAAIQGALQTNSVVGVTGYLFPPAMRFVNNRFQLLHRQPWAEIPNFRAYRPTNDGSYKLSASPRRDPVVPAPPFAPRPAHR